MSPSETTRGRSALDDRLTAIARSPRGSRQLALFDFDRTLIQGYSVLTFVFDALRHRRIAAPDLLRALRVAVAREMGRAEFHDLLAVTTEALAGTPEADLAAVGERLFTERIGGQVYEEARRLVEAHRAQGHTVAICSSATRYQVAPVARDLDVGHLLVTELEHVDGVFTGRVGESLWHDGKLRAAVAFARRRRADLAAAWFYSDGIEDLPLLEMVGHPCATNPDPTLARVAADREWPVLRFTSRRRPGLGDVVRTGLAASSAGPSLLAAAPTLALNRDWQSFLNLAMATWGDFGTAVAGIDLRVVGEQHLWSHRPAVFLFNHQSYVDVLVLLKLIRRDLSGVAKIELRHHPVVGPVFRLGRVAFVDRSDRVQSVAALHEVVGRLREGVSLAIAPEGTRSPTSRVGPFKKGAFRVAMQGGVPVVPIVIRNAADVLPRGARVLRPATIDVVVLEPRSVDDWPPDDLDRRVAEVHARYVETLRSWPGDAAPATGADGLEAPQHRPAGTGRGNANGRSGRRRDGTVGGTMAR
jgi:putative phosphoserine phosphatase/1-acylglycerol-3-phosphate O-acyltransferase